MKQYTLQQDYRGWPSGTVLFGPYPITGSMSTGYFRQADIPKTTEGGTACLFSSFVEDESNSGIFKLMPNENKA